MMKFEKFVFTPAGFNDATLAIAACRAGGVGVLNGELGIAPDLISSQFDFLAQKVESAYGVKLAGVDAGLLAVLDEYSEKGLGWLIFDIETVPAYHSAITALRDKGVRVLAEVKTSSWPGNSLEQSIDGLILKGNESGGFIGEKSSFILVQKWRRQTGLPLYVRGGLTPYVAAACSTLGLAGGVLDSQVLLLDESPLAPGLGPLLENLTGNETVAVGDGEQGSYFRLLVRPGHRTAKNFCAAGEGKGEDALKGLVQDRVDWQNPVNGLLPIGQDVCFAGQWRKQYGHLAALFRAIDAAVDTSLEQVVAAQPLAEDSPLARELGIPLPLVQGPMSRVSDRADFAKAVADGGGLPMMAFALYKEKALTSLLDETTAALGDHQWGIGLLGFAPQALLDEQLAVAEKYKPGFAIIAGGRPDQAVKLEKAGILSFLHVPSAKLMPLFLQEGARRFIFEGRECGGHIGPLSGFVLWSTMVDCLVSEIEAGNVVAADIQVLFAGGIHDAVSSAMVQLIAAPLVNRGVKIGFIMGSSYLFTKEIVGSGAILPTFQEEVIKCEHTVSLESGPGHASRCAYTPFAKSFFNKRRGLLAQSGPGEEARKILDDLIMGRLRIAAKGCGRVGDEGKLVEFDESSQQREGMYMLGQLATLRSEVTDIATLHGEVTTDANRLLADRLKEKTAPIIAAAKPVDIAIIGIASLLPKAKMSQEFWENILAKVDAITEIPPHRWDWRLYYDENRETRDKIYSRWGGFLDDLVFDPMRYGMPPKSIESVDPMQLMALEVAFRTLVDAGYEKRDFDRERTSVIIGASGGAGDVGMQYGLRAELPRFQGDLPDAVARRLPEWTEDTFAGILLNVVAGRIANRLDLGGVNFTTDAACASSLASIYQGVSELVAGRSNLVIAGGVDTAQGPFGYLCFSKTQALSPRGRCSTFDVSADGIVISEGIAMVALKRLADAERDGDRIYALIKGVGGSSDGRARGLTAPLPAGQLRAMRRAYQQAGFGPDTVGLFEAHGTGTVVGDTAELESTTRLIKEAGGLPRQAVIGSVKTLIGHTKATAGVAGLIKSTLALHHRILPPHFGVKQPNQVLQQTDCPLYLIDEAVPWVTVKGQPRRAAASAFGFGGTNFHIVLEEYRAEYRPWLRSAVSQRWPAELVLWNAVDRKELIAQLTNIKQQLEKTVTIELRDLAYSLAVAWPAAGETIAVIATDSADLSDKVGATLNFLKGDNPELPPGVYHRESDQGDGKLAVLFSGQGAQYPGMLRELMVNFPVLAETLAETDEQLREKFATRFGEGQRLSHFIFPRGSHDEQARVRATRALTSTDVSQPALGAVEAGLWRQLRLFGLEPDMVAGHSYGEFSAFFAAGVLDFESLMSLSEARGRFIVDAVRDAGTELGTMAAVQAPRDEVEKAIADIDGIIVANHNAPQQIIISGSIAAVKEAAAKLTRAEVLVTELPVAAAFHSSYVAPAQSALADLIETVRWQPGRIPVYSNTTGEPHPNDTEQIKRTMTDHLVRPVEFLAQIEAMYRDGARVFFELGPRTILTGLVGRILEGRPHRAVAIDGNEGGITGMLHAFGQLLCAGVKLDVHRLFEGRDCLSGDPADLAWMQQRREPTPKHAWLLNGSRARRVGEPVKQIGVRMEELRPLPANGPRGKAVFSSVSQNNSMPAGNAGSRRIREEGPQMGGRRQGPAAGDPAIMADYFDTMRQFLETQERIMSVYMGRSPSTRSGGPPRPSRSYRRQLFAEDGRAECARAAGQAELPPCRPDPADGDGADIPAPLAARAAATPPTTPPTAATDRLDLENMTDMLLTIVEDKTGYPRDMVGLDQNLESDLGIDSIKRVEIVGALLKTLPPVYGQALGEDRGKLNTQATLNGMLDLLAALEVEGGAPVPFDQAETGTEASDARYPFRHIIQAKQEAIDGRALKRLGQGHFIITRDRLGVAERLSELLQARGCTVGVVESEVLGDEVGLRKWCAGLETEAIAGIVHLAPLGSEPIRLDAPLADWRSQLQVNEKSLFLLLHDLDPRLNQDAHIVSASGLGGFFNRNSGAESGLSLQGGGVGLLKSLFEERPGLRVRAVDIDPEQPAGAIANSLADELELVGGRQEVGYPRGKRTIFQTVPAPIDVSQGNEGALHDLIVLATGGLKGVTAEILREVALPGNTLILTGRSPLPEEEPEELRSLTTPATLREHFIAQVRNGSLQLTPAAIQGKVRSLLAAREMRNNLEEFHKRGAAVEYHAVDVTDLEAMQQLLEGIYDRHGALHGVVHGAGVIEDKLLAEKSSASWSRVVETKIMGLLLLLRYLRPDSLRFFTVLSSVAGRYGNSGQTDYGTANELMNRLCCQVNARWGDAVTVRALCWGPWGATTFGAGMVTEETAAKFAAKGVTLVSVEAGRRFLREELTHPGGANIEIVCGEAPWEEREAAISRIETNSDAAAGTVSGPLLAGAVGSTLAKGDQMLALGLGEHHAYLQGHRIDGTPVLPAAVALEIMAEAADHLWPGWKVTEVRDCQLLKGVELRAPDQMLRVVLTPPPYGNSDGFEVNAMLQSKQAGSDLPRIHYRAVLRLEQQIPSGFKQTPKSHTEKQLSVAKAYNEWLFHGPCFQVIEKIEGLSDRGAKAVLRTSSPGQWVQAVEAGQENWLFDPGLVDAAAQMGLLWARAFRNESALPARFGRVVRYAESLPDKLYMDFERVATEDPHLVRANVVFSDAEDNVMLLIEDMECVSSPELNRLGGTEKYVARDSAWACPEPIINTGQQIQCCVQLQHETTKPN